MKQLFYRTKKYHITITKEHCAGCKYNARTCPGYRAFKDAVPFWKRIFFDGWISYHDIDFKWYSFNSTGAYKNMVHAQPGDEVYFVKY